ncbi:MAG: Ig-like domain-containing protein [Bacilli bacterium]
MKKKISVVLLTALAVLGTVGGLVSCGNNETPVTPTEDDKISVTLSDSAISLKVGESKTITATTNPVGKTVMFTTSDSDVASVAKDGTIKAQKVGKATITATTADDLTATCEVTVTEEAVPSLPSDTTVFEVPLNNASKNTSAVEGYEVTYADNIAQIDWSSSSIKDSSWDNYLICDFPTGDFTRKTDLHIMGKGSDAMTVYYKILSDENTISEGELTFSNKYSDVDVSLAEEKRYLLGQGTLKLLVYAPKPGAFTDAGSFMIAHAYMNGDKDKGEEPSFDINDYEAKYNFPTTNTLEELNASGIIYDQISGSKGDCTVTYGETGVTFTNKNNFNDWGDYAFKFPEYDGDKIVDYTGVTKIVAKINASEGAWIKYRSGWSASIEEVHVTSELANKDFYIVLTVASITPWDSILDIAPLYRDSGYTSDLTITVKELMAMAPKAN